MSPAQVFSTGSTSLAKSFRPRSETSNGVPPKRNDDVELEIADDLPARFEPAQDLVRRAPARRLHEAGDGAFEAGLARDLGLLLIGVVALHRLEVLAQKFVVVEIALDELALVLPRLLLGLGESRSRTRRTRSA